MSVAGDIKRYLHQLAPHCRHRDGAVLLVAALAELTRMRERIERLRGTGKWAAGMLLDAGDLESHDRVMALVGDMEAGDDEPRA